ncbi:Potato inhibitor I family protein [Nitzschia inconspicua]|uniref:Potato inhibitor I family protein n=1 Tax=Nitzschia inconspicua TaxID=303405 RepID=A0A9K3PXS3_9STRA|nr:Potato inhibitor I family protein [Nitzschia inconspicua]
MDNHPLQTLSKEPTTDMEDVDLEEQQDHQKQQESNKSSSLWSRTRSSFLRTLSGNNGEEGEEVQQGDAETPNNKACDDVTVDSEQLEPGPSKNDTPPTEAVPQSVRKPFFPVLLVLLLLLLSLVIGLAVGLPVGKQEEQPSQVALSSNDGINSSFMDEAVVTKPSLDRFHNGQPWSPHDRDVYGNVAPSSTQHQDDKPTTNEEILLPTDTETATGTTQDVADCFPPLEPMQDLTEFPCLVGMDGHEAQLTLEEAYPSLDVYVLHIDSPVTMDLRWDRVRIFVDDLGMVATIPYIG